MCWSATNGRVGRRFFGQLGRTSTVEISPDGTWLASGGEDGRVQLWHNRELCQAFDRQIHGRPWGTTFSPCGRWMAVVAGPYGRIGWVIMFDARSGKQIWESDHSHLESETNDELFGYLPGDQIAFSSDGDAVVFLTGDKSVCAFESATGKVLRNYGLLGKNPPMRLRISSDDRKLTVLQSGSEMVVVDRDSGEVESDALEGDFRRFELIDTCLGDRWLSQDTSHRYALLDLNGAKPAMQLAAHADRLTSACVSRDGRYLATGGTEGVIYLWDLTENREPTKFVGHEGQMAGIWFSADGRTLLSSSLDGTVRFWDLDTHAELFNLGNSDHRVVCAGLHPDDKLVVLGIDSGNSYGLRFVRLRADGPSFGNPK